MTYLLKLSAVVLLAGICGAASSEMTNAPVLPPASTNSRVTPASTNFEGFRLIVDRNIFNQSRTSRSARRTTTAARVPARIHSFSLVGTMSYPKGDFAFFDGTSSEYKKPAKAGDKIAGYEIKEISAAAVKIANEKQDFELKVGQQLRREDEGDWALATGPVHAASAAVEAREETLKGPGGDNTEEEALKRLMEKRAKEMNR